jgi:hypothetical protein
MRWAGTEKPNQKGEAWSTKFAIHSACGIESGTDVWSTDGEENEQEEIWSGKLARERNWLTLAGARQGAHHSDQKTRGGQKSTQATAKTDSDGALRGNRPQAPSREKWPGRVNALEAAADSNRSGEKTEQKQESLASTPVLTGRINQTGGLATEIERPQQQKLEVRAEKNERGWWVSLAGVVCASRAGANESTKNEDQDPWRRPDPKTT